ncbi:hypothetical protein A1QC_08325 [Vibrio rumoiensis 1S-45]|uniref:Uncharacterized protein n=1 Tax=Vibrio rumoiensis 1S-45 TaxID=1188252 RepID=A0A1E5E378_9VIBR|nr:hypothetical protein A1QC_08325 [Vibrio rumoiensis 1S-45]
MPHLYQLFLTLDQDQADELFTSLQEKYQEDYEDDKDLSEADSRKKSQKRMTERVEDWIGDLTPEQMELVKQWSLSRPLMRQDWYQQQLINKSELQVLYLQRNDSKAFQQKFTSTLLHPEQFYPEALNRKLQKNRALTYAMFAQVIQGMTDKQLKHYHEKLREWRETFEALQENSK